MTIDPKNLTLSNLLSSFRDLPKTENMQRLFAHTGKATDRGDFSLRLSLSTTALSSRLSTALLLLRLVIRALGINISDQDFKELVETLDEQFLKREIQSTNLSVEEFFAEVEESFKETPFGGLFDHLREKRQ